MKRFSLVVFTLLCIASCVSGPSRNDPVGPTYNTATDGSSSSLSRVQAVAIATSLVRKHEPWIDETPVPNQLTHNIFYVTRRINQGAWRVVAYSTTQENAPDGGGGNAYESKYGAVVIINKHGAVVSYSHSPGYSD